MRMGRYSPREAEICGGWQGVVFLPVLRYAEVTFVLLYAILPSMLGSGKHSTTYCQSAGQRAKRSSIKIGAQPTQIALDCDSNRVLQRYLNQKADLVERLLTVKQAYAEIQPQLARLQFAPTEVLQKMDEEKTQ
jgi:hypothetical protein